MRRREDKRHRHNAGLQKSVGRKKPAIPLPSTSRGVDNVYFLPLDEAIASGVVFVIVSGSDGRVGGRKRFLSQLNN